MRLSISEILSNASTQKTKQEKIDYLRRNDNGALRLILKYAYDPVVKFVLPEGEPPYTPAVHPDNHGMLYTEARRLYLFVEGGNNNLHPLRREALFVQLLEAVNAEDAKLLCAVKDKKLPYKTITPALIRETFPGLLPDEQDKKEG